MAYLAGSTQSTDTSPRQPGDGQCATGNAFASERLTEAPGPGPAWGRDAFGLLGKQLPPSAWELPLGSLCPCGSPGALPPCPHGPAHAPPITVSSPDCSSRLTSGPSGGCTLGPEFPPSALSPSPEAGRGVTRQPGPRGAGDTRASQGNQWGGRWASWSLARDRMRPLSFQPRRLSGALGRWSRGGKCRIDGGRSAAEGSGGPCQAPGGPSLCSSIPGGLPKPPQQREPRVLTLWVRAPTMPRGGPWPPTRPLREPTAHLAFWVWPTELFWRRTARAPAVESTVALESGRCFCGGDKEGQGPGGQSTPERRQQQLRAGLSPLWGLRPRACPPGTRPPPLLSSVSINVAGFGVSSNLIATGEWGRCRPQGAPQEGGSAMWDTCLWSLCLAFPGVTALRVVSKGSF